MEKEGGEVVELRLGLAFFPAIVIERAQGQLAQG